MRLPNPTYIPVDADRRLLWKLKALSPVTRREEQLGCAEKPCPFLRSGLQPEGDEAQNVEIQGHLVWHLLPGRVSGLLSPFPQVTLTLDMEAGS